MAFDAYNDYRKAQRTLPIIIVAILLVIIGIAFHGAYVRSHAKPKPTAAQPFVIPYTKLAAEPETHHECHTQPDGWTVCGNYPTSPDFKPAFQVTRTRKHKRARAGWDTGVGPGVVQDFHAEPTNFDYRWSFVNTIPTQITCSKPTGHLPVQCESRPLTPQEIKWYTPTCLLGGSVDGSIPPCVAGASDEGFSCFSGYHLVGNNCEKDQVSPRDEGAKSFEDHYTIQLNPGKPLPWFVQPSGEGIEAHKPTCVMPADIDVCPIQMLDPKDSHD